MAGPLSGFRIIDMTSQISGPLATMILADQGAEVIKVENPSIGDHTRVAAEQRNGMSASFVNNNRNKQSIAVDMKVEGAVDVVLRLCRDADVFIQNFRPGVTDRMGVGEAAVRAVAPNIVYVSISGFGAEGPLSHKPVFDPLVQALSGLTTVQAGSDDVRPKLVRTIVPDKLTGITASQAVTAALLARERTGQGQHVHISMLDSIVAFLWSSDMNSNTFVGDEPAEEPKQSEIDLIYETSDGYITVAAMTDKQWYGLTEALERQEWREDPRFSTPAGRQENVNDRLNMTQEVLRTRGSAEWLDRLEAADVPCVPVLKRREMIYHPQVQANELVIETEHPVAGPLRQSRGAARFSASPETVPKPAPLLGEQTDEILAAAGYSAAEIEGLKGKGVVAGGLAAAAE
jgi:crotonobetainyl-CoA:carnitine CoA-transferase CaiB-like acyl-CoA transferase